MSNQSNTNIMEQVAERIDGLRAYDTDFEWQVSRAIEKDDMEQLQWLLHNYCDICGQETTANCNNANCDV
jgi:hypothetical protein